MARFRRRARRGYRRFLRRKPRAFIRRGRVMKAAYRTSRLNKGADTIVTRTSSEAHSSFFWDTSASLVRIKFGSSQILTYSPYEAESGIFSGLDPRTGWIGLSDRFRKLCALYDTFRINYIKFDIALTTPACFNPATYVTRAAKYGYFDREIVIGVLVDRCHARGASGLTGESFPEFWTDPATIQTNCKADQFPRICVTVKPRRGEYSPWFDTPDTFGRYLDEYHNKSIVTGFLPAFYYAARITGEPSEVKQFLTDWSDNHTIQYFNLPLKLKVTYGVTFRGSLSNASITAAKVAEVVNPTEHMEEFDLKADTTIRVEPVDA